jgi:tRNA pseudouridine55 synthase
MTAIGAGTVNGLLLVDKPAGITSHDVVARVRRAAHSKRVGHAGTLDPFATGLLVLALGPATRLLPYVDGEPKVYEATVRFGAETDTDDATGSVTRTAPMPDFAALDSAMTAFVGTFMQRPPAFSAKHVNGERAYALARRGKSVELAPVSVTVHSAQWRVIAPDTLELSITCAGGTYIRALARDIGRALSSAAHCLTLRRTRSGSNDVADATSFDALTPGCIASGEIALRPPLESLSGLAVQLLDTLEIERLRHGRTVPATVPGSRAALIDAHRAVLAIAERDAHGEWQPRVVLTDPGIA